MSGTIPSTPTGASSRPASRADQSVQPEASPLEIAAGHGATARAERLVRPDVATHYIEAGDRLGGAMIAINAALWAALARGAQLLHLRPAGRRRGHLNAG